MIFGVCVVLFLWGCRVDEVPSNSDNSADPWPTKNNAAVGENSTAQNNKQMGNNSDAPLCGNGRRDAGEFCDGDCPTTSADCGEPRRECQAFVVAGAASTCDAECVMTDITVCKDGDGCCPSDCNRLNDSDCGAGEAVCGDGIVEGGESCDGDCPFNVLDCPKPTALCSVAGFVGNPLDCTAECIDRAQTECQHDDDCCPAGCWAAVDNDCVVPTPTCGDGMVDPGETCDGASCPDGLAECPQPPSECFFATYEGSADTCTASCLLTEQTACVDGDGCCPERCVYAMDKDCPRPDSICGDGVIEPGENCDGDCPINVGSCDDLNVCTQDAFTGSASMCTASCTNIPITSCVNADGCCPVGCDATLDSDCAELDLCNAPIPPHPGYAPASVIKDFDIEGRSCCFDIDGDGAMDNRLGELLSNISVRLGANASIQQRINSGEFVVLFEHEGLTELTTPSSFQVALLDGAPQCFAAPSDTVQNIYKVDPESYDAQGQPLLVFSNASIDAQGRFRAGRASFRFTIEILNIPVELILREVQIEADLDTIRSGLPNDGVALNNGSLSGIFVASDLYEGINDFTRANCGCLNPPNPAVLMHNGGTASCDSTITAENCSMSDTTEALCKQLVDELCTKIDFVGVFADIDSTNPSVPCSQTGNCDAYSVGATFRANGARLIGLDQPSPPSP